MAQICTKNMSKKWRWESQQYWDGDFYFLQCLTDFTKQSNYSKGIKQKPDLLETISKHITKKTKS